MTINAFARIVKPFSSSSLRMMHQAVIDVIKDNLEEVREHQDFKQWARAIESELDSRNEAVTPADFSSST